MQVKDISVEYIQHTGSDLQVANAARVSFDKVSDWEEILDWHECGVPEGSIKLSDKDEKLIKYLASHKHFSPFNHSFITVKVRAPIFVSRQMV